MSAKSDDRCAVCGHRVDPTLSAYLLMAQAIPPRIAILRWNKTLAAREQVRTACSPEHTLEIVAHWMVSGLLDINFTQPAPHEDRPIVGNRIKELTESAPPLAPYCQPIGELVINRDSVRRLVASDPEALASVLDSLLEVLLRDGSFRRQRSRRLARPPVGGPASRNGLKARRHLSRQQIKDCRTLEAGWDNTPRQAIIAADPTYEHT